MSHFKPPEPDYDEYSLRQLLAVPLLVFTVALLVLGAWFMFTGAPVELSMVFVGGTEVRVGVDAGVSDPVAEIEGTFSGSPDSIASVPGTNEYIVTFPAGETTAEEIEEQIDSNSNLERTSLSQVAPTLGDDAQQKALMGIVAAFILMSILVIVLFRSIIPAVVIVASAISDVLVPLAAMNLLGIELSFGTVGALLMLIGYSVDSDILLNTYVLKSSQGAFNDRVHDAMRTGVTMTVTSLSAMVVMFIVASLFGIGMLADMGLVLAIGLAIDLVNTYMMNVGILRWYTTRGDTA